MTIDDWQRFTDDLKAHAGVSAEFHPDPDPDSLHLLQINEADFFFNADGSGYDGWGRRANGPVKPERN